MNHLSTALLILLLLPALSKSPEARVTIVASGAHHMAPKFEDVETQGIIGKLCDKDYCTPEVMGKRYEVSKRKSLIQSIFHFL